jgi:hypothetical protein
VPAARKRAANEGKGFGDRRRKPISEPRNGLPVPDDRACESAVGLGRVIRVEGAFQIPGYVAPY